MFPLGNPFLSQTTASQLLGDTSVHPSVTSTTATPNITPPSLLSSATGNSSSVAVPVTIGESALQSAAKAAAASHGNNNKGESTTGD